MGNQNPLKDAPVQLDKPEGAAMPLQLKVPLRYRDMDMIGHLNQSVYHTMLEQGRVDLFRRINGTHGGSYVLARTEIDYLREVRLDEVHVYVETAVETVGNKSLTFAMRIVKPDGVIAALARTVVVCFDMESRGPREMTEQERDGFKEFML